MLWEMRARYYGRSVVDRTRQWSWLHVDDNAQMSQAVCDMQPLSMQVADMDHREDM